MNLIFTGWVGARATCLHTKPVPDDFAFTIAWILCKCIVECIIIDIIGQVTDE